MKVEDVGIGGQMVLWILMGSESSVSLLRRGRTDRT